MIMSCFTLFPNRHFVTDEIGVFETPLVLSGLFFTYPFFPPPNPEVCYLLISWLFNPKAIDFS